MPQRPRHSAQDFRGLICPPDRTATRTGGRTVGLRQLPLRGRMRHLARVLYYRTITVAEAHPGVLWGRDDDPHHRHHHQTTSRGTVLHSEPLPEVLCHPSRRGGVPPGGHGLARPARRPRHHHDHTRNATGPRRRHRRHPRWPAVPRYRPSRPHRNRRVDLRRCAFVHGPAPAVGDIAQIDVDEECRSAPGGTHTPTISPIFPSSQRLWCQPQPTAPSN